MRNIIFLIPFFNEESNLIELYKMIEKSSIHNSFNFKILFLNDCSTDSSHEIITSYSKTNDIDNLIIYENSQNLGHGKSLVKLYGLAKKYEITATDIVTMDSDMRIKQDHFNEILVGNNSIIGKRKRFEDGVYRGILTFIAEILVFIKTGKLWRDTNCPFRVYKIKDFQLITKLMPKNLLTPNIVSTIIFINSKIPVTRKSINLIYDTKNSGETWKSQNLLIKYYKIFNFSFKSFVQVLKIKII